MVGAGLGVLGIAADFSEEEPEADAMEIDGPPDSPASDSPLDEPSTPRSEKDDVPMPLTLPTWVGAVKYQFHGIDLTIPVSGHHVEGAEVGSFLPPLLKVEHRMDLNDLLQYLPRLDQSSSRARVPLSSIAMCC